MNVTQDQWRELQHLSGGDLKARVFALLRTASLEINSRDEDDPGILELVPRLSGLIQENSELSDFRPLLNTLANATGLWNYIDKATADIQELLVAETVTVPELGGLTLHREQVSALNTLLAGRNLILSAPTSFGKSLLIDALLASKKYSRIAVVLPTIALLDEFRRRIRRRFTDDFNVVMHPSDHADDSPTIFLGTQERLISRKDLGTLDLTVVDEFYKLDPSRHDDRSVTLNAAVYKLLAKSRQFFFLGPNIDQVRVSRDARWKFEFLHTRFATVAVDTYDLSKIEDKEGRLIEESSKQTNWPALVFVSSPDRANKLAAKISEKGIKLGDGGAFADWLRHNVGGRAPMADAVASGVGLHHGRVPRAIASHMIRLFNIEKVPILLCTSTLIEGVNTAAKTVLIFDKEISRRDYDFFTFSNIKGRAGRLGQHHVGNVFLFNTPPGKEDVDVSPTLFSDADDAPDGYAVHLDDLVPNSESAERVRIRGEELGLDKEGLKVASAIGFDVAAGIQASVSRRLRSSGDLVWKGWPDYASRLAVIEVICENTTARGLGAFSAKHLAYYVGKLQKSATIREFLLWHDENHRGDAESYDVVFKFLRACEYGLPQLVSMVELFVQNNFADVDYKVFSQGLSSWFRPEQLRDLDEEGIPIQISERFFRQGDSRSDLTARLIGVALRGSDSLSEFERQWVLSALDT